MKKPSLLERATSKNVNNHEEEDDRRDAINLSVKVRVINVVEGILTSNPDHKSIIVLATTTIIVSK